MSKYFHRGKEARSLGKDRILNDARISVANRRDFYAGWDEQDRYMQPPPTLEEIQEADEALEGIRTFLQSARGNTEVMP